ncbi:MAG: RNA methyltransferase [Henriciella sp.]|nr:RNA methyltransferase [Henriciella sp.]
MSKPRPRNRPNSHKRKSPSRPHGSGENWLWGVHAVTAALANPKRKLVRLVGTKNGLDRLASKPGRSEIVDPGAIDALLPRDAVHQGLAAQFEPLPPIQIEDVIARGATHVVVLDQVSDPHNLGAIFRSAAAFGFGALVLQTRNAPPISGIVGKAAVGAIETVSECRVVNIARALDALNEAGFHTVGLAGEGRAQIEQAVAGAAKLAIVLGAEGPGLRPGVAKACAELARIPIASEMESLNVSNAAAIAFYEAARSN